MSDLAGTRSVLRIIHNAILFGCIISAVSVSVCNKQGLAFSSYALRLFAAFFLVMLYFLFKDMILGGGENKNFFLFTGQLLVGIAVIVFAGRFIMGSFSILRVMMMLCCILIGAMAYFEHNSGKPGFYPSLVVMPLYVAVFLFGRYLKDSSVTSIAVAAEIAAIFVSLIDHELTNLEFSIKQVKDRAYVPTDTIRKQNRMQLGMFMLPMTLLIVLCFLFPYSQQVADFFMAIIVFITRVVINLLLKTSDMIPEDAEVSTPESLFGQIPTQEYEKLSRLWDIVFGLATVIMVGVIVWAIISLIRQFYKKFKQTEFTKGQEISEFLDPGEEKKKNRAASDEISFFDRSPEASLRRVYKRFIKKQPGAKEISRTDTPAELEKKALGDLRRNYLRLHVLYEKARYSPGGCAREDVSEAMNAIREGRR